MSIELTDYDDKSSNDYKAFRARTVGSSDIAAICGLNKWRSPLKVWMEKTGKLDWEDNDNMLIGRASEEAVAKVFAIKNADAGQPIKCNKIFAMEQSPWATATPDFFLASNEMIARQGSNITNTTILEAKTARIESLDRWDDDQVPDEYVMQVCWQLGVLGLNLAWIAALIGGFNYRSHPIEFDEALFKQMFDIAEQFRGYIEKDIPPNAGPGDSKIIDKLFKRETKTVPLDDAALPLIQEYLHLKGMKSELTKQLDHIDGKMKEHQNNLLLKMGDANEGLCSSYLCQASTINRKAYPVAATSYTKFAIKEIADAH